MSAESRQCIESGGVKDGCSAMEEEFLCVVPEFGEKPARKLGEEFCRSIERLGIPAADPEKNVTVSVGMAVGTIGEREEFEALLEKADEALYQAKNSGRNRVV